MFCGVSPPTLRAHGTDRLSGGQDSKTPSLLDDILITAGLPFRWNGTRAFRSTFRFRISSRSQRVLTGPLYCLELSRDPAGLRRTGQRLQSPLAPWCLATPSSALQWSALPTLAGSLGGGIGYPLRWDRVSGFTLAHSPVGPFRRRPILVVEPGMRSRRGITPHGASLLAAPAPLRARGFRGLSRLAVGSRAIRLYVSIASGMAAPTQIRGRAPIQWRWRKHKGPERAVSNSWNLSLFVLAALGWNARKALPEGTILLFLLE